MAKHQLRIIPLGGLGEIGKNMTVFEYGNDAFILDTGIMFPANDMLGVDYIIPDFNYLLERDDLKIHGIVFTHGHEDHIGAIPHVIDGFPNVPLYATSLTAGLIEVKLRAAQRLDKTKIHVFNAGDNIQLGPFKLESFHVTHSIPDCVGFGINTPHGLIVHTGDYKFDNTPTDGKKPDYAKLAEFSKRGVLLLMADSTNADKRGWTPSEAVVQQAFDRVFQQAKGRIIIASFASQISRIQQAANAAERYGRVLAVAGFSMTENIKMARKLNLLDLPDNLLVDIGRANQIQAHKVVIMVTGSQGEPSAVLSRLAHGKYRQIDIIEGDTVVVSAHPIPGNEELVFRTINRLYQRGADVIYDPIAPVHVSGHCSQEEMRLMINLVNPRYFMPVHGELRHLRAHANLAMESGIPRDHIFVVENGMVLEVDRYGVRRGERVPGSYVFVDGSGVGDIGKIVIRDREILARDGFLVVSVNVDKRNGKLLGDPEIISRGFVFLRDSDDLIELIRNTVADALTGTNSSQNGKRREKVEDSLSRVLYNETKRRPMVFSIINDK